MEPKITPITIRTAQDNDLHALADLCVQLGYPASENIIAQRLRDLMDQPEHRLLVALNQQAEVIAWIHGLVRKLLIADAHIELGGLVVDKAYRGHGIGEKLLVAIEGWAREIGIQTIFVRSNIIRLDAHRFYERLGYQMIKTSKTFQKNLAPK